MLLCSCIDALATKAKGQKFWAHLMFGVMILCRIKTESIDNASSSKPSFRVGVQAQMQSPFQHHTAQQQQQQLLQSMLASAAKAPAQLQVPQPPAASPFASNSLIWSSEFCSICLCVLVVATGYLCSVSKRSAMELAVPICKLSALALAERGFACMHASHFQGNI